MSLGGWRGLFGELDLPLSCAIWLAYVGDFAGRGEVRAAYCCSAWAEIVESWALSWLSAPARRWPAATTPSFAASLVGESARLFQEVQNADSWLATPVLEGSLRALCACSSSSACVEAPLRALFCVRYCASR